MEIRTCYVGPPGKHFDMTEKVLQLGRPVLMAGFPAASDQDYPRQPAGQPMITAGTICCYDRDFELAAATYPGGRSIATAPGTHCIGSFAKLPLAMLFSYCTHTCHLECSLHFYCRIRCSYPSLYSFCNNISCGSTLHLCDYMCAP